MSDTDLNDNINAVKTENKRFELVQLSADLVAAYISNNTLSANEVPNMLRSTHATLTALHADGQPLPTQELISNARSAPLQSAIPAAIQRPAYDEQRYAPVSTAPLRPAIPIKDSVTPDYIICLEDGKPFKSLKRHLKDSFGMTPEEYKAKWKLPADYPMTAPNYSAARQLISKNAGFGRKGRVRKDGTPMDQNFHQPTHQQVPTRQQPRFEEDQPHYREPERVMEPSDEYEEA